MPRRWQGNGGGGMGMGVPLLGVAPRARGWRHGLLCPQGQGMGVAKHAGGEGLRSMPEGRGATIPNGLEARCSLPAPVILRKRVPFGTFLSFFFFFLPDLIYPPLFVILKTMYLGTRRASL
jgi:hypothetical protein